MRGLGGRTYIVTGAASGIGRATAARLLDEGALVMGADLVVPPDDVAEDKDESGRWAFTHVDVTDEDSVAALPCARPSSSAGASTGCCTRRGWQAAGRSTCCRPRSGPA